MADQLSPRMKQAVDLVVYLNKDDARKKTNIRYLAHLFQVCSLVMQDGGDEDEGIAGLLHDALEDKAHLITRKQIEARFGERVARMVVAATDTDPDAESSVEKEEWSARKVRYIRHLHEHGDPAEMRVSLADKVYNLGAILRDHAHIGDEVWGRFNARINAIYWYYSSLAKAYHVIGVSSALLPELDELVAKFAKIPGANEPYHPAAL